MVWYSYRAVPAVDPETGQIARGVSGQVYALTDTTFSLALPVRDVGGSPMAALVSNHQGLIGEFQVEDHDEVNWKSGDYVVTMSSYAAVRALATEARDASAATSAAMAALKAEWESADATLPSGGNNGDVLYRSGDRQGAWGAPPAGTGGAGASDWYEIVDRPTTFPPSPHTHTPTQIDGSSTVGRAVLTAADAQSARSVIGAGTGNGTSNLTLGTSGTTAAAGNHAHSAASVTFAPAGVVTATNVQDAILQAAATGSGGSGPSAVMVWRYTAGSWPTLPTTRPAGVQEVRAIGPTRPPSVPGWVGFAADRVPLSFSAVPVA